MIYSSVGRERRPAPLMSPFAIFARRYRQCGNDRDCEMMYTLKGGCAVTFLLFTLIHGELLVSHTRQQQRHNPAVPPLPWRLSPPWEYILREIVLKSVTPRSLDTDAPYERPLDASFYGGPVAAYSNDDANVVLSRGDVHRLVNGHWMLCQEGCLDCEPCMAQRHPSYKWILRRIKRLPSRHDLQLTIMPQADDHHLRTADLWPNSYVYVTSHGERKPFSIARSAHGHTRRFLPNLENSFPGRVHRPTNGWPLTERDSIAGRGKEPQEGNRTVVREDASTERTSSEESSEQKHRNGRPKPTDMPAVTDSTELDNVTSREEADPSAPRLILGIDQLGQKHLVHMVPIDDHPPATLVPNYPISSQFAITGQPTYSDQTVADRRDNQTYQRIFRRVFDSLNAHRRSIERFLDSSSANHADVRSAISSTTNNTIAAALYNRSADSETMHPLDTVIPPLYVYPANSNQTTSHQRHKNGHRYGDVKRDARDYSGHWNVNRARLPHGQAPIALAWNRQRRRVPHAKPYSVNGTERNISLISLPILARSLDNSSSVDAILTSDTVDGLITNAAKRIGLNDTFADKAVRSGSSDAVRSIAMLTERENGKSFDPERSGSADRSAEVLHHPFRIIVTTESPIIRNEYKALNRILRAIASDTSIDQNRNRLSRVKE